MRITASSRARSRADSSTAPVSITGSVLGIESTVQ